MTYEEIPLPRGFALADAAQLIEEAALVESLRVGSRGTHTTYAGSIYWHFKQGTDKGTLEAILLNRERRIHLSVPKNRHSPWTEPALERIAAFLHQRLMSFSTSPSAGRQASGAESDAE